MAETPEFDILIDKLTSGRLTASERSVLNDMLEEPGFAERLRLRIDQELATGKYSPEEYHAIHALLEARITEGTMDKIKAEVSANNLVEISRIAPVHRVHFIRRFKWVAAAVILFAVATTWFVLSKKQEAAILGESVYKNEVLPGKSGAVLTTSDGRRINLDTAGNGLVLAGVEKTGDSVSISNADIAYATIETPPGRTIHLTLSDGTLVWLNAASSIRFPSSFKGNSRDVAMTGEAYFGVTHNEQKPFRVHVNSEVIEDIGTAFNVNAYTNEATLKTTLIEGSVKVGSVTLTPGQQLSGTKILTPDISEVVAWKEGNFKFKGATVEMIMRQLSRWYDVEVVFEGQVADHSFVGTMGRDYNLTDALKVLEASGVHFRLEGRKVTVLP